MIWGASANGSDAGAARQKRDKQNSPAATLAPAAAAITALWRTLPALAATCVVCTKWACFCPQGCLMAAVWGCIKGGMRTVPAPPPICGIVSEQPSSMRVYQQSDMQLQAEGNTHREQQRDTQW